MAASRGSCQTAHVSRLPALLAALAVGLAVTAFFANDAYWFIIGAIIATVAAIMIHVTEKSPFPDD